MNSDIPLKKDEIIEENTKPETRETTNYVISQLRKYEEIGKNTNILEGYLRTTIGYFEFTKPHTATIIDKVDEICQTLHKEQIKSPSLIDDVNKIRLASEAIAAASLQCLHQLSEVIALLGPDTEAPPWFIRQEMQGERPTIEFLKKVRADNEMKKKKS